MTKFLSSNPLAQIGKLILSGISQIGKLSLFLMRCLQASLTPPFYISLLGQQILRIGYYSIPVVALTSFFTGGVLVLQIYGGGNTLNAESIVASIVALGITRELAPVLSGLMVAGRVSAAIAAEIGTMRVTEQIDALTTLATNPLKYLVAPRLLAAIFCLPLLAFLADIIGIFGGFVVATASLDFNAALYIQNTYNFIDWDDVASGLIKASVFGFILAFMGAYCGYHSAGGAQGVGRATTQAVVSASILILASNYLLTSFFFAS